MTTSPGDWHRCHATGCPRPTVGAVTFTLGKLGTYRYCARHQAAALQHPGTVEQPPPPPPPIAGLGRPETRGGLTRSH